MTTFAKFAGLHTAHNYVGSTPPGAQLVANNVVISSLDTVEPRRGQYSLSYGFGSGSDRANAIWNYGTSMLVQYGTKIARDTGAAFTDYTGTFTPVDDTLCRMRGFEAAQNFYVNTATGVKVLDSAAGTFSAAGVPQCLDVGTLGFNASTSGFFARDRAVGYRAVIAQRDANNQWREGPPSQRTVVTNTDLNIVAAQMTRSANVVTVSIDTAHSLFKFITVGSVLTLSPGEADFAAGVKTVTAVDPNVWSFTYAEVGANTSNGVTQTFQMLLRSNKVAISLAPDLSSSDVIRLYRTEIAASAATDPGDECYQVAEIAVPSAFTVAAGGVVTTGAGASQRVTVTKVAHWLSPGQRIAVVESESFMRTGSFEILTTTANTFTYSDTSATASTSVGTITITPLSVVYEDITPDALLGDALYTNPNTGDGIEASNYIPPRSVDMVFGGERVWWLNTTDQHRLSLQLLGTGSGSFNFGSTFVIRTGGVDFTVAPSSTINGSFTGKCIIYDFLTPALNVERTAYEIVRTINQGLTTAGARLPFYAVYTSATDDVPGKIEVIEYGVGGSTLYASSSIGAAFSPALPAVSAETVPSDNGRDQAGVMWSKSSEPESRRLSDTLRIGAKGDPIYKGIWLRDSLFIFKKQGGVFTIPNQLPFRPRELDPTCRLLSPDSVVTLNNQIFALTDQGLVTVTEAGVDLIGWPADYDFRKLVNTARAAITRIPFAVAYESDRQLWLWLPTGGSDTYAMYACIYNHATHTLTGADKARRCGTVMPGTDILWMGSVTSNTLARERKSFDVTDYADETYSVTLNAVDGTTLTLSSTANVAAGDLLTDAAGHSAYVVSVSGSDVETNQTAQWVVSTTLTIYSAFTCQVTSVPLSMGEPGIGKGVPGAVYTFREPLFYYGNATVSSDEDPLTIEYPFTPAGGYGSGGYGAVRYGLTQDPMNKYVTIGASGSLVSLGFKIRQARAKWKLLAVSPQVDLQSERGT